MIDLILSVVVAFVVSNFLTKMIIPRLTRAGITGGDENKPDNPQVPEMGGLAIVAGFAAGVLMIFYFVSFTGPISSAGIGTAIASFNQIHVLAAMIAILAIAFIGVFDDLFNIPQWLKAFSPLLAAAPLVALKVAGSTLISIPFMGMVDFGLLYIFVLVPIAIAVCSNLTNMLAGFNGMEAGMGLVMFFTLSLLGWSNGSTGMTILSISMFGALLGFLLFNWYPARIFPGDVGALTIGVALASAVIIGNLESAGVILMIPYMIDFFIKAANRFPHTHQELRDGKLYPKDGKVKGLVHVAMKAFNGLSEKNLVMLFIGLECFFALIALLLFFRP